MTTHLSVRLTWHDSAWNGCICTKPTCNVSCVQHQHVREGRKLDIEENQAGRHLSTMEDKLPPCSRDTGAYSDTGFTIRHHDPLEHRRLPSGDEILQPYTCCPSPYRWMREENLRDIMDAEKIQLRSNDEGRDVGWVYEPDRQRDLLKYFWSKIEPGNSLVFYYLNQANPLTEEHARILVGIGRVKSISQQLYFGQKVNFTDDYPIWSRGVTQNYPEEGVRLPYQEYLQKGYDTTEILCPVPTAALMDFSYVGEHVSDDVALSVVEQFIRSVQKVRDDGYIAGDWDAQLAWLDHVLHELWSNRSAFPGIGGVLQYLGFTQGVAFHRFELSSFAKQKKNAWQYVKSMLDGDSEVENRLYEMGFHKARTKWQKLTKRHDLLSLLARFHLSDKQIQRLMDVEARKDSRILSTDSEIIGNPYLISEQDIGSTEGEVISLDVIDHGMRPEGDAALFPHDDEIDSDDPRLIRAVIIDILKAHASAGDSLLSFDELFPLIKDRFPGNRQCQPDRDLIEADEQYFKEALSGVCEGKDAWFALKALFSHEQNIKEIVIARSRRATRAIWDAVAWQQRLESDSKIGQPKNEREKLAIQEKLKALEILVTQKVSVLTGGAGTGKTTVLKMFLDGLDEMEGRQPLLLLAPTGKARVRLSESTGRPAATIHQFLFKNDWYDTERYILKEKSDKATVMARTVVIDESSMMPIDLLGTLLNALNVNEITRLIFVGDHYQLPPIGPGRPFYDIVNWMQDNAPSCLAKLETCMRTVAGDEKVISVGLELANTYRSDSSNPADDELLSNLAMGSGQGDIEIDFWSDAEDLLKRIEKYFNQEYGIGDKDYNAFSASLGFSKKDWAQAESWQILSPTRRDNIGTEELNRIIQGKFKGGLLSNSRNPYKKSYPKPFGESEIIWSDKVIQTQNSKRNGWPSKQGMDYVANGEIGLVETTTKDYLQVHFSTQPAISYRYYRSEVGAFLELAYALTVHKAQGSDFDTVFLILPQSASTLTRELVYTALTRFRRKIVLLVEKDIQPLLTYRNPLTSDVQRRNSFVFELFMRSASEQKYFAEGLIHRAKNGQPMRSKSEVIVADILLGLGLEPRYEVPLYAKNSKTDFRLPDFTVSYQGDIFYWEHLGMLTLPSYSQSWARKKKWYKDNGLWEYVITSEDKPDGGIDAAEIEYIARSRILEGY